MLCMCFVKFVLMLCECVHVCRSTRMCGSVLGVEWAIIRNKDRQETFLHHTLCLRGGERKEGKKEGENGLVLIF